MDPDAALAYLVAHSNYDTTGRIISPTTARIERLMALMGDPQRPHPVIHITGTNGKGSTAQMITRLLMAQGLTVGTYTSPHLERVNERITRNGEPISDEELAEQIVGHRRPRGAGRRAAELLRDRHRGRLPLVRRRRRRRAVVEVGLLGRWDATNVVDGQVAVVTNIGIDHTEFAGPTLGRHRHREGRHHQARQHARARRDRPRAGGHLPRRRRRAASMERGEDFDVRREPARARWAPARAAHPDDDLPRVFLPLHGRHQGDNASAALTAVEAFFDAPLAQDVVEEGFAEVRMPGRFEVLGHQPLVIVDGAHNPPGADTLRQRVLRGLRPGGPARSWSSASSPGATRGDARGAAGRRVRRRDLLHRAVASRGIPAADVAAARRAPSAATTSSTPTTSSDACDARAAPGAGADDAVLVTGSLYVVGARPPRTCC